MRWPDMKTQIAQKLQKHLPREEVILVDGFVHLTLSDDLQSAPMVGTNMPMVACIGKESAQVYLFSVMQLIKSESLNVDNLNSNHSKEE